MNYKNALILFVGLLVFASPSWAQQGSSGMGGFHFEQPAHRFEIIPMYGYVWTVSQSATYSGLGGDVDLKSTDFWGVALDINVKPGVQARLLYRRQDTEVTWKRVGIKETLGSAAVEYWHIGAVAGMRNDKIMPYTSLTLGTTRYILDYGDEWKFSIILGVGAKVYLNDRIGLMVGGQMPFTFTNAFLGLGTNGMTIGGTGIIQLDLVAGLIIAI